MRQKISKSHNLIKLGFDNSVHGKYYRAMKKNKRISVREKLTRNYQEQLWEESIRESLAN